MRHVFLLQSQSGGNTTRHETRERQRETERQLDRELQRCISNFNLPTTVSIVYIDLFTLLFMRFSHSSGLLWALCQRSNPLILQLCRLGFGFGFAAYHIDSVLLFILSRFVSPPFSCGILLFSLLLLNACMHVCVWVCECVVFSLAVLKWIYLVWQNIWQVLTHGIFMLCFGATILHAIYEYAHRHTIYFLYVYITCTIVAVYISGSWAGVLCGGVTAANNNAKQLKMAQKH